MTDIPYICLSCGRDQFLQTAVRVLDNDGMMPLIKDDRPCVYCKKTKAVVLNHQNMPLIMLSVVRKLNAKPSRVYHKGNLQEPEPKEGDDVPGIQSKADE